MPRILEERMCLARVLLKSILKRPPSSPSFDDSTRIHCQVCKRARILYPSSFHHSAPLFSPHPLPHLLSFSPLASSRLLVPSPVLSHVVSPSSSWSCSPFLFRSCLLSPPHNNLSVRMGHRWREREIDTNTETDRGREATVGDPHTQIETEVDCLSLTPTSRARSSQRDPEREIATEIASEIERVRGIERD